jgi:hypothetical protein
VPFLSASLNLRAPASFCAQRVGRIVGSDFVLDPGQSLNWRDGSAWPAVPWDGSQSPTAVNSVVLAILCSVGSVLALVLFVVLLLQWRLRRRLSTIQSALRKTDGKFTTPLQEAASILQVGRCRVSTSRAL